MIAFPSIQSMQPHTLRLSINSSPISAYPKNYKLPFDLKLDLQALQSQLKAEQSKLYLLGRLAQWFYEGQGILKTISYIFLCFFPHLEARLNQIIDLKEQIFKIENERKQWLLYIQENGLRLGLVSYYQTDKEIVLAAVRQNGQALKYASKDLQDDREVVLAAVEQHGQALRYASERLRNDKEVVSAAVREPKTDPYKVLLYADERFQDDPDVVLSAIANDAAYLYWAKPKFKDNRDMVLQAIKKDGNFLKLATARLRDDKELVLEAIKKDGRLLEFASDRLKDDEQVVNAAIKRFPAAISFASNRLINSARPG